MIEGADVSRFVQNLGLRFGLLDIEPFHPIDLLERRDVEDVLGIAPRTDSFPLFFLRVHGAEDYGSEEFGPRADFKVF